MGTIYECTYENPFFMWSHCVLNVEGTLDDRMIVLCMKTILTRRELFKIVQVELVKLKWSIKVTNIQHSVLL